MLLYESLKLGFPIKLRLLIVKEYFCQHFKIVYFSQISQTIFEAIFIYLNMDFVSYIASRKKEEKRDLSSYFLVSMQYLNDHLYSSQHYGQNIICFYSFKIECNIVKVYFFQNKWPKYDKGAKHKIQKHLYKSEMWKI